MNVNLFPLSRRLRPSRPVSRPRIKETLNYWAPDSPPLYAFGI